LNDLESAEGIRVDVIYIALTIFFFLLCMAYAAFLSKEQR